MKSKLVLFFVLITFVVSGCASVTKDQIVAENIATQKVSDPIEPFNRVVFSFNNVFDKYAVRPVSICIEESYLNLFETVLHTL